MIDRLSFYAEIGVDEVILSSDYGQASSETPDMMAGFASEVTPKVARAPNPAAA